MKKIHVHIVIVIIIGGCFYSSAFALTNEEIFSQFSFNFITPGARAIALGGAFIGLADDATAVESNPAGLTTLAVPEISTELQYLTYTTNHIYENLSAETAITRKEFEDSVISPSFTSIVYPYKRFVFSLYRQELVRYKMSYETNTELITIPGNDFRIPPINAAVDLAVTNYGIGAAVEIFEGFSIAISPRWSTAKMQSHLKRFQIIDGEEYFISESKTDDKTGDFSLNSGIKWNIHPRISLGAVYKIGPDFNVDYSIGYSLYGIPTSGVGLIFYDPDNTKVAIHVPDLFGAGIAFRVTEQFTLTLDIIHIQYENLLEDFSLVDLLPGWRNTTPEKDNFTIKNVTEIHFGAEYLLSIGKRFLAVRTGGYYEPEHSIRFTGTTKNVLLDKIYKEVFPGNDAQTHITGGFGLIVNDHFQIDAAANIAKTQKQLTLSVVYRF